MPRRLHEIEQNKPKRPETAKKKTKKKHKDQQNYWKTEIGRETTMWIFRGKTDNISHASTWTLLKKNPTDSLLKAAQNKYVNVKIDKAHQNSKGVLERLND